MKKLEGNIYDYKSRSFLRGTITFDEKIRAINEDHSILSNQYIVPGIVDAHVHIESSMLTPVQFGCEAIRHGVLAVVTDPHEIANVCGKAGVMYMLDEAEKTPLKICTGVPSCVPATEFETSGGVFKASDIDAMFATDRFSHLSEMMNYPGVVANNAAQMDILSCARRYNKPIDGHAPGLLGNQLKKYIDAGISTDHECTDLDEALEKIKNGMKILLRWSTASNDFGSLQLLVSTHTANVMLCADDCLPDDLRAGYLRRSVVSLLKNGFCIEDIIQVASVNPVHHYDIPMGLLQINDPADFLVIDDFQHYTILESYIDGLLMGKDQTPLSSKEINTFYVNNIELESLKVPVAGDTLRAIKLIDNSLFTETINLPIEGTDGFVSTDTTIDLLKIVVLNRYNKATPSIGYVVGFGFKQGAIATTIAHDSHNIIAVGVSDSEIHKAICAVQKMKGGLVVVDDTKEYRLPLPVGGLMTNERCKVVADKYTALLTVVSRLGSKLRSPFGRLSFLSLLVIPELKIGDKGLFDVNKFEFINLQSEHAST